MTRKDITSVNEPSKHEPVRADDIAALVRAGKAPKGVPIGQGFEGGMLQRPAVVSHGHVEFHTSIALPAYSIFGVVDSEPLSDPQRIEVDVIGICGGAGSHLTLFTNGHVEIPAGSYGVATAIHDSDAMRVRVTGTMPAVGSPCGVKLNTLGVTALSEGFVCLSEPDENNLITVVRTREPVTLIMESVGTIQPFLDNRLGLGVARVMYRLGGGTLCPAKNPATQTIPWLMPVWSGFLETIPDATTLSVQSSMGVGLVVNRLLFDSSDLSNTTTSTTTTTLPACTGMCKFDWDAFDSFWELDEEESTCALATTTSTSSTSTTTTTEALESCECDPGSTTTTTSTSSTSTTEPSEPDCECTYPAHCGSMHGECTYTFCGTGQTDNESECPTSTSTTTTTEATGACCEDAETCVDGVTEALCEGQWSLDSLCEDIDCATSTTTTTCPEPEEACNEPTCEEGYCYWAWLPTSETSWSWHLQSNNCCTDPPDNCSCTCPQPATDGEPCEIRATQCEYFCAPGSGDSCTGNCLWFCAGTLETPEFILIKETCTDFSDCVCVAPDDSMCDFCTYYETNCQRPTTTTTEPDPCEPTTTTTEPSCQECSDSDHIHSCRYTCENGGAWSGPYAGEDDCLPGCSCPSVMDADLGDCPAIGTTEVQRACCGTPVLDSGCEDYCKWRAADLETWVKIEDYCVGDCDCVRPPFDPHSVCEVQWTPCISQPTTTTSTTTSTTTTTEGGECDNCPAQERAECGDDCEPTVTCQGDPVNRCIQIILKSVTSLMMPGEPECLPFGCTCDPDKAPICEEICVCWDSVNNYFEGDVTICGTAFKVRVIPSFNNFDSVHYVSLVLPDGSPVAFSSVPFPIVCISPGTGLGGASSAGLWDIGSNTELCWAQEGAEGGAQFLEWYMYMASCTSESTTTTTEVGACCDYVGAVCHESGTYNQGDCESLLYIFYPSQTCSEITCGAPTSTTTTTGGGPEPGMGACCYGGPCFESLAGDCEWMWYEGMTCAEACPE